MRGQRGQATIDYLAVILLVALVLGAAAAVLVTTGLGERVVAAVKRALCVVTGEACEPATSACVLAASRHEEGLVVDIAFVRLGGRSVEMRERYADGTVAFTVIDSAQAGAIVRNGVEAHVRWGASSWAYGVEQRFAMLAERSAGRTWVRPSEREADAVSRQVTLERLSSYPKNTIPGYDSRPPMHAEVHAPPPEVTFSEIGGGAEGSLDLGEAGSIALAARRAYGERVDRRTGERTVYVSNGGSAAASVVVEPAELDGAVGGEERYGITFDRDGRPRDLMILTAIDVEGQARLPRHLAALAGRLRVPLSGARHIETEQHLDLTAGDNARLAAAFLGGSPGGDVMRTANLLRDRLDAQGSETIRTYRTDGSEHEVGAHAALGPVAVGAEIGSEDQGSKLDRAIVRGPGGVWGPDSACDPARAAAAA